MRYLAKTLICTTLTAILMSFATGCTHKHKRVKIAPETEMEPMEMLEKGASVSDLEMRSEMDAEGDTITKWDELARFIAGMEVDSTSQYHEYGKSKGWQTYKKKADMLWTRFETTSLKASAWKQNNMGEEADSIGQILYPFSGADWAYVHTFFPYAKEYVMLALEPVGSIPSIDTTMTTEKMDSLGAAMTKAVADILGFSFFLTNNMKKDLRNCNVDGTTPIMMMMLARTGKHIRDITIGRLTEDGSIDITGEKKPNIARFEIGTGDDKQTIDYVSGDISNYAMSKDTVFAKYLDNRMKNGCGCYMKAASYLMHSPNFVKMKKVVLQKSSYILQDDSGIKYKDLKEGGFECELYGEYTQPLNMFRNKKQNDLKEAYENEKPEALGFRIGYGPKYNLIIAKK